MVLEHLNITKSQLWPNTRLAHLNNISTITADTSLGGQLKIFLLTCKVNDLSPRTVDDYAQKNGAFVMFCNSQGIKEPKEVTANHIRVFLLLLKDRIKAVSVHDYYGCVNRFFNWLVEEGVLDQSPMARMRPPKVPKQIIQPFTPEDIRRLLVLCDSSFLGYRVLLSLLS
jgi:site-specific recombinase XerD